MDPNWPELEKIRQQKQAQARRARTDRGVSFFPGMLESKVERALHIQALEAKLAPYRQRIQDLAGKWDAGVKDLLTQVAASTWGDNPAERERWSVEGKIIWRSESQTPSLYWEALFSQSRYLGWYGVELRTDLDVRPVRFVITCNEADYTISTGLSLEALKAGLVQAYRLGPLDNIFHQEPPGILIGEQ